MCWCTCVNCSLPELVQIHFASRTESFAACVSGKQLKRRRTAGALQSASRM